MRYKIKAADQNTFECVVQYLDANAPGQVKLTNLERRVVSAEDLSEDAVRALKKLGAQVSEDYQFGID